MLLRKAQFTSFVESRDTKNEAFGDKAMIQKVSLLLTFIFSSSLISIFELGFRTFYHRILKVKSQTLEETKFFSSLDSAYFSLLFSVCQTWCLVFSLSDMMFGVLAARHGVWCLPHMVLGGAWCGWGCPMSTHIMRHEANQSSRRHLCVSLFSTDLQALRIYSFLLCFYF